MVTSGIGAEPYDLGPMLPGLERHPHARAVLRLDAPSHAYLFHGPAGAGKREVARAFAAELLADGAPDPDSARARALRGAHPDLTWVAPSGAADMLVSDIDEPVVAAATRTPFESRRRVFVIERADTMNDEAANRMLKTLEEPPAFAHLVLLTDRPGNVIPTIASRCQHVRFDAPPADELAARLEARGVSAETARACARLSLGDGDKALVLALGSGPARRAAAERFARACLRDELGDRPWKALLDEARRAGEQAVQETEGRLAAELEVTASRDQKRVKREGDERARRAARRASTAALDHGLQLAGLWLRDLACLAAGAVEVVHHTDRLDELREDAAGRDVHRLRAGMDAVEDTRQRLVLNVAEELALEALAYRLARIL
jgi:DNA polymerase III subunit delta'